MGGEPGVRERGFIDSASCPEKDEILADLLCCEMVARHRKSLGEQLMLVRNQVGSYYPRRENFRLTPEVKEKFTEKLRSDPQRVFRSQGLRNRAYRWHEAGDDGSWVCYRLSGTESVVRVYSEARDAAGLEKLSAAAKQWIFE